MHFTSTTHLFRAPAGTSMKALFAGAVGSLVLFISIASAHELREQRQDRSAIVKLDPVVISARREQLPTVFINGRRDRFPDDRQVAEL